MAEPETLSQVLARLEKAGFVQDFKADQNGSMRVFPEDTVVDPDDLTVDAVYRFEGESNLDDEEVIFALSCAKLNLKGTFITAFGPQMDSVDAHMVHHLQKKFHDLLS